MKKISTLLMILVALMITGLTNAQTVTNVEELNRLSIEFAAEWDAA